MEDHRVHRDAVHLKHVVGASLDASDAPENLEAGPSLVQVYTALIYRGPLLDGECVNEIHRQREAADAT